jgi:hypothetical protein
MELRHLRYFVAVAEELHFRHDCSDPAPRLDMTGEPVADVAAGSRASLRIDSRLVDEAVDAYVDWREECIAVWSAYGRWVRATIVDAPLAFSAYRAAVDREECASHVYAALMTRIAAALAREEQTPPGSDPDDRDQPGHTGVTTREQAEFWLSGDQGRAGASVPGAFRTGNPG